MMLLKNTLIFFAVFFIGSIPTAYLVAKRLKGIDIRQCGSGNVGATNAFRVLGKGPGRFVFAVDFFKGFLPALILGLFVYPRAADRDIVLLLGLGAMMGHVFTPFLGFKGGKGVATGAGILCATYPAIFLTCITVWGITFAIWRVVSISSLFAMLALGVSCFIFRIGTVSFYTLLVITAFVIWTHRTNISRILSKTENKIQN